MTQGVGVGPSVREVLAHLVRDDLGGEGGATSAGRAGRRRRGRGRS
ncbi:hypothetical protein [Pseudonocardia sp.]|nr:hypothetical protein [Pseudonocardia sp.]